MNQVYQVHVFVKPFHSLNHMGLTTKIKLLHRSWMGFEVHLGYCLLSPLTSPLFHSTPFSFVLGLYFASTEHSASVTGECRHVSSLDMH